MQRAQANFTLFDRVASPMPLSLLTHNISQLVLI
jgi:hypothetical protein